MDNKKHSRSKFAQFVSQMDIKLLHMRNKLKYRFLGRISAPHIVVVIFIALTGFIFLARLKWFGNPLIPDDITGLFFGAGAVTGAMLAIVFAFSSQLVSRASEALPARYFNIFARDIRLDLIYFSLGLITLAEFVLGLIFTSSSGELNTVLVRLGIWLVLFTIVLLYFAYTRLITLLSHEYQVSWLAKYHTGQVKELTYLAKRMTKAAQRGYIDLSDEEKLIIEGNTYEALQDQINTISNNLDGVIELYFTYKNKGDDYAAHNYIHVAFGMVMSYALSRQKNSLLKINPEVGLTPESSLSGFLQNSFEKTKIIWDTALAENDVYAIRKYLRDVQGLVRISATIEHPQSRYENPAYYTSYYNFSQLVKDSIKAKNIDALFEIASVLEQIAQVAITKQTKVDALDAILDDIRSVLFETIKNDEEMSAVTYNLVKNLLTICNNVLTQEEISEYRLRKMQQVVPVCLALSAVGSNNNLTDVAVTHFGDNIFAMATHNMDEPPSKKQVQKVIQTSKFTISVLNKFAAIATGERHQSQSFDRSIMVMAHTLTKILKDNLATDQQAQDIRWILNDLAKLPESLPAPKKTTSLNDAEDFVDRLIQAAITALAADCVDVATNIFDYIHAYLNKVFDDGDSKVDIHDILHAVNKTKLIGATARKLKKQKAQQHVAEVIRKFEKDYLDRYYPGYPKGYDPKVIRTPSPLMLRENLEHDGFEYHGSGLPSYFHDAKAFFLEFYSTEDIKGFESYIWQ